MALLNLNFHPDNRQLRQFGWTSAIVLPVAGWICSNGSWWIVAFLSLLGLLIGLISSFYPHRVKPAYLGLSLITMPIGLLISEIIVILVFTALVLPIAIVFRLLRRDPLQLRRNPCRTTYWLSKQRPDGLSSYLRQS